MVLLPSPAAACSCVGESVETFSPAFVNIPTNAVLRFVGNDVAPHPREISEDGVLRTDVVNEVVRHGASFVLTQRTEEPFRLGAIVEVRATELESFVEPGSSFTLEVVDDADLTPPEWDGAYTVDNFRTGPIALTSCGRSRGHAFTWEGMTDDLWDPSELLVIAVPQLPRHAEFVGDGESAFVGDGACSHDDDTLKSAFHRTYDIFVEDGSGNRIGPFEVDTRQCGCAGVPSPANGVALLLVAAMLVHRRRSWAAGALVAPSTASAFDCGSSFESGFVSPLPGIAGRPTNSVVHVLGGDPGELVLFENGVQRNDLLEQNRRMGGTSVLTLSTVADFRPGATIEVKRVGAEGTDDSQLTFVVGDEPDTTPPVWDGAFTVDSRNAWDLGTCFPIPIHEQEHDFHWIGMEDDAWQTAELLVIADPRLPAARSIVGDGNGASVARGLCIEQDPSLRRTFHRVYDVFVEDGSGNRTGPFEVDTREGRTGCAVVPAPGTATTLLLATACVASYCSRRPRIHARRPPSSPLPPRVLEG